MKKAHVVTLRFDENTGEFNQKKQPEVSRLEVV